MLGRDTYLLRYLTSQSRKLVNSQKFPPHTRTVHKKYHMYLVLDVPDYIMYNSFNYIFFVIPSKSRAMLEHHSLNFPS